MNEQEFQTKLAELMGEISTLPPTERQKLEKSWFIHHDVPSFIS